MQYKIVEKADDAKDAKIEKLGVVVNFTWNDVVRDIERLKKALKEIEGQKTIDEAKMKNIEQYHPIVLTTSPEDMVSISLYADSKGRVGMCNEKIAQIDKQLADYEEEMEDIAKQIPELIQDSPIVEEAKEILKNNAEKK